MGKYREPQSANEAALQNLLGEQNELREPQSPVEFYLQEMIEEIGGGGSGELPVVEIKNDENYLFFEFSEQDDFISNINKRTPFLTKKYRTLVPYEAVWIPYAVRTSLGEEYCAFVFSPLNRKYQIIFLHRSITANESVRYTLYYSSGAGAPVTTLTESGEYAAPQEWWDAYKNRIISDDIASSITVETTERCGFALAFFFGAAAQNYLVPLASANPDTWFAYYMPVTSGETEEMVSSYLTEVSAARSAGKVPVFGNNFVITGEDTAPVVNMVVPDFTNNRIMEYYMMCSSSKIMFKFICHEAQQFGA